MLEVAQTLRVALPPSVKELREMFLITGPMLDLESVLKKFLIAQKLLASEEILERLAYEAVEDAFNDGIRIVEFRYAPTFIQHGHPQLSLQKIHEALLKGLARAEKVFPVATGLICILQRILDLSECEKVARFAIDNKKTFIGVDLADNETANPPEKFKQLFDLVHKENMNITIHSGETPHASAAQSVKSSIETLHATRIGHGVQIIHDPGVMNFVKSKNVILEVCPISNYLTQAFPTYADHPVKKLMDAGVGITINTDDPGIFATTLTDDYLVLHQNFNFTETDFQKVNDTAYKYSFIAEEKKKKVWR